MSDEPVNAAPKKKGGWPKGRPRVSKVAPVPAAKPREAGKRWQMTAGANWEDPSVGKGGSDQFHINRDDFPEGMDFQWVVDTVAGANPRDFGGVPRERFEAQGGWTPVHPEDFDGAFDGYFGRKGAKGEINVGGQVLMARPMYLSERARAAEIREAQERVALKQAQLTGGDLPGVSLDSQHPSALRSNRINRTVERIDIPGDKDKK